MIRVSFLFAIVLSFALEAWGQGEVWRFDNLTSIGGHAVTLAGAPRVVETEAGKAIEFNGVNDGIFFDVNPLAGLKQFTVEVEFQPAPDGPEEQRFFHVQEGNTENRALIELRILPGQSWCLDTYLRYNQSERTLIDRGAAHASAQWHTARLTFDGQTMKHYVDGALEQSGDVAFKPLAAGRTSVGVRQNRVFWFKGRIRRISIIPQAQ
jgi:hypothetical protein